VPGPARPLFRRRFRPRCRHGGRRQRQRGLDARPWPRPGRARGPGRGRLRGRRRQLATRLDGGSRQWKLSLAPSELGCEDLRDQVEGDLAKAILL